jgi:quinol monooxygenase YgiN
MPTHITLTAAMTFKEPADDAVRAALSALVAAVRQEPGCLEYNAHVHAQDQTRVLFYERWQDQAALDVHAKAAALTDFRAAMDSRFAGPSELQFWKRLG